MTSRFVPVVACTVMIACGGSTGTPTTPTPTATALPPTAPAPLPTPTPAPTPAPAPAPTPPTPPTINVTGSWTEPSRELPGESEGIVLLTQTGSSIAGTVVVDQIAGVTVVTNSISGSVSGNNVTMTWIYVGRQTREGATRTATLSAVFSLVATSSTAMAGPVAVSVTANCTGSEACPAPTSETFNESVSLVRQR